MSSTDDTDRVGLDIKAAVQIANLLEKHYEHTKDDANEITADAAAHFAEAIRDQIPELHRRFGPDYYCRLEKVSFESQEMYGSGQCPWCGRTVEPATDQEGDQ